jgi:hypothetical protein
MADAKGTTHLLFLLDKDEQEDLSADQRKSLRDMVAELKRQEEPCGFAGQLKVAASCRLGVTFGGRRTF